MADIRKARAGVIITGNELFQGLIQDRFGLIIALKLKNLGKDVVSTEIVPDNSHVISETITSMIQNGCDLIILTTGLSVDSDDVTIEGVILAFCVFQLMFAIMMLALITRTFVERMKFSAFLLFTIPWTTFVYHPICQWAEGGGLLWFDWFGFDAGSALSSSGLAVLASFNTQVATNAAALVGLLTITPAAGFVGPLICSHRFNCECTLLLRCDIES